ncbi:hypothetical protein PVK06_047042 [Gossypium arboreum]|uniref:Uncharacterized protein n=1 Tax=Gossypium arboreum TaxID=29729 RepID=A0ABR0MEA4_GOSAR|nr:hypothetical protein PVK06_047042 [Gossypium arboreum]
MASSGFSPAAPPASNGEGYHIWVVKMKTPKQAWDRLKEEFQGKNRTRQDVLSTKAVKEEKTPFAKVENEVLVQGQLERKHLRTAKFKNLMNE